MKKLFTVNYDKFERCSKCDKIKEKNLECVVCSFKKTFASKETMSRFHEILKKIFSLWSVSRIVLSCAALYLIYCLLVYLVVPYCVYLYKSNGIGVLAVTIGFFSSWLLDVWCVCGICGCSSDARALVFARSFISVIPLLVVVSALSSGFTEAAVWFILFFSIPWSILWFIGKYIYLCFWGTEDLLGWHIKEFLSIF